MGWLAGYAYRSAITINHSGDGALTDWKSYWKIYSGAGANAAGVLYLGGLALNWPNDIQFTDSDGTTTKYYYREEDYTASLANIQLRASVPAHPDDWTGYIYWGKAADTDHSDIANTFTTFYDNFPGVAIDTAKWAGKTDHCTVASGVMTFTADSADWHLLYAKTLTANNVRGRILCTLQNADYSLIGIGNGVNTAAGGTHAVTTGHHSGKTNHSWWQTADTSSTDMATTAIGFDAAHKFDFVRLLTGTDTARTFYDDTQAGADCTTHVDVNSFNIIAQTLSSHIHFTSVWVDIATYNPPVLGTPGAKEDAPSYIPKESYYSHILAH